jgi:hypothetical protein
MGETIMTDSIMIVFLALFFTIGIPCVIAFLIFYLEHIRKPLELAKMGKYDEYTESKTIKEKVIVKEVVMLPCQYCGSLMPQTSLFCPHCGARRKN